MGNCQAVDAATLVIQYPSGRAEKLYWPVSASEVMKANPGHYVTLLLSTTLYKPSNNGECPNNGPNNTNSLRLTRIKLLRHTDTLALGHVYRLVTTEDVMKGMRAKKQAKMRKNQQASAETNEKPVSGLELEGRASGQVAKHERNRQRTTTSAAANSASATARPRTWQPSLHSISEASS